MLNVANAAASEILFPGWSCVITKIGVSVQLLIYALCLLILTNVLFVRAQLVMTHAQCNFRLYCIRVSVKNRIKENKLKDLGYLKTGLNETSSFNEFICVFLIYIVLCMKVV